MPRRKRREFEYEELHHSEISKAKSKVHYDPLPRPPKFENEKQAYAWELLETKRIVFLLGATGSGKTFLPTAYAALGITSKKISSLIITRPAVTAGGEDIGFLPGDLKEKFDPYMAPIHDNAEIVLQSKPKLDDFKQAVKLVPLAYCRGRTFRDCIAILDEAQNVNRTQLKLWLTRIGRNGKLFITGDSEQADIPDSPLMQFVNAMKHRDYVGVVKFDKSDIARDPIVSDILEDTRYL